MDGDGLVRRNASVDNLPSRLLQKREEQGYTASSRNTDSRSGSPASVHSSKSTESAALCTDLLGSTDADGLDELSWPPTQEELANYKAVPPSKLPKKYRRDPLTRIYVNRDLRLDKITYYGFDMDYTLAIYNSPDYEILSYNLMVSKLLEMGYPEELKYAALVTFTHPVRAFKYDPEYPVRGLFLDKHNGNFLKVDNYGTISICVHGHRRWEKRQIAEIYPVFTCRMPASAKSEGLTYAGLRVAVEQIGGRYYLINTLFSVPEAVLYADLVELFDRFKTQQKIAFDVSYANIFHAMDFVHLNGSLKAETLANLPKYIKKDAKLPQLLAAFRKAGKKSFLMTNSEWYYTNEVMAYLLDDKSSKAEWTSHFAARFSGLDARLRLEFLLNVIPTSDIVIVNANKPKFFEEGSTLREIDAASGKNTLAPVKSFQHTKVYAGGSIAAFHKLTGVPGEQVLYIGDHIFADVIRSKKTYGWRTLLIVPELTHEVKIWKENEGIYHRLLNLEWMRAEMYRGLEADSTQPPEAEVLRHQIKATREEWNAVFNKYYGSLFRSGSKQSFFSMQVLRYADIYTSEYSNLLKYPLFYLFAASVGFAPHENEHRGENMVPQA